MVPLWVSAIVYLEHMALSLGLGGPRGPQNDYVHLKPRYIAFLASNLDISAVYGCIRLCFGYGAPVGLCYHICGAHAPINRFRGPWGPLKRLCTLKSSTYSFLASNLNILAVHGPIGLCFRYDAPEGLCYHISRAHGPITRFRGPWGP